MKSTQAPLPDEHDDDLDSTVGIRDDVETDDYPKTDDDFEGQEQNDETDDDDRDDDS